MGPELILIMNAGLRKCPETFFRTLGAEDVTRFHPEVSPTDTLGHGTAGPEPGKREPGKARRRL